MRTVILDGFFEKFVRYRVQVYLESPVLFATDGLDILVDMSRATLMERATALLVLSTPVIKLVCRPESTRGSDCEVVDAQIHSKDCSVLAPDSGVSSASTFRIEAWRYQSPSQYWRCAILNSKSSSETYLVGGASESSGRMYSHSTRPSTVERDTWSR